MTKRGVTEKTELIHVFEAAHNQLRTTEEQCTTALARVPVAMSASRVADLLHADASLTPTITAGP